MAELPKAYEPKLVEEKLARFWEEGGFFKADAHSSKPAYSIPIPPPNVTGVLHMGHALVNTLQDTLIRYKRMSGYEALWIPGTDHAGIATQTVVERSLMAKTGKRRVDFPREEFMSEIWKWKEESEKQILSQLRRLGCSCDWSRLCFTMDAPRSRAVKTIFKKMFDAGLIYRGDYLVNWDPATQTALADDEVEYEEKASSLWSLRFPLEDGSGVIVAATTRPETTLGDTAIAVSPDDERYRKWVGLFAIHPITKRRLPIIADRFVDPSFGTGAVKITPAHDHNDYEMGKRHNLELVNIMTPDGKINEKGGRFAGLSMLEARTAVADHLKELGMLEKITPHTLRVGVSYRSKAVIEPYLSKQWFVKMSGFKEPLMSAVKEKRVALIPENWENTYFHWIENLRDWCISRQLWWGHRIPIWYKKSDPETMICYDGEGEPPEIAANPQEWVQDPDVLDTWFSSALWPFSTLGWPEETPEFKKFYPQSVLITGHDILFFWVARMIMMGEYTLGKAPFPQTFLHGLIYGKSYWRFLKDGSLAYLTAKEREPYDEGQTPPPEIHSKWEKMSKSKGNIIDPIEIIDRFGTDAMRMALCASATGARQIDLDRRRFEEFKNFANKIWNGARFALLNLESLTPEIAAKPLDTSQLTLEDKWILSLLNRTISDVSRHLDEFAFDRAATLAYEFFWKQLCAYYLELAKPTLFGKVGTPAQKENKQKILLVVLDHSLRLIHPMAPFITEELFGMLKELYGKMPSIQTDAYTAATQKALTARACIIAPYPLVICEGDINEQVEKDFAFMDEIVHAVRTIRAEMQLPPHLATDLIICGSRSESAMQTAEQNQNIIQALVRINQIQFVEKEPTLKMSASQLVGPLKLIVPLPEEMREKERLRLLKEEEKLIAQQNGLRAQLANDSFVQNAPPQLVAKTKEALFQSERELLDLAKKLEQLTS